MEVETINSGKNKEKDECNQKNDILRPVQQDAELKDRSPKKKLSGSTVNHFHTHNTHVFLFNLF